MMVARMNEEATVHRVYNTWNNEDDLIQFTYSDNYPPYMKTIPVDDRKNPLSIFNFASFAETTALLFIQPNLLWSKLRNLAPDQMMLDKSMRSIEAHNFRLHTEARLRAKTDPNARDMYFSKNVGLRRDWYTDTVFGQQQFTGTNPTTITLASSRWRDEFMSVSQAQGRTDVTKLLTESSGNIYVQDYSDYRPSVGLSPEDDIVCQGRYGCSTVALFHLEPEGQLHPLAIVPDYKGSMGESVAILNRRIASDVKGNEFPIGFVMKSLFTSLTHILLKR
ncbi:lipoxygenase [Lentinula aciculospora]|uniref:Lipoxygenase n=1 Tax=Lentinula aciculospora TaxID=153920 RepID=A0A9W8ZU63_9AGAR|nr:lipoxygenase [Lentinula aciculospora]